MQKIVLILILLLRLLPLFAQHPGTGWVDAEVAVKKPVILRDHNYSFESIRTSTALVFTKDSLHPALSTKYWLKIEATNNGAYAQQIFLTVFPNLDNTLFYYNENNKGWIAQRGGIQVATDKGRVKGVMPLVLQGRTTTTFYVLLNLGNSYPLPKAIAPRVIWESSATVQQREGFVITAWIVSLAILLLLFINNLYVYYRLRDLSVFYLLFTQLGGAIYITAYRSFFKVALPSPSFSWQVLPNGSCFVYSLNNVFMHISVAVILFGSVQMTRSFLQTKTTLPFWDRWLRYFLFSYLVFTTAVILINLFGFNIEAYTILYDNVQVLAVAGLVLATSIAAYRRRQPAARAFLLANALPLLLLMSVAGYHVLIGFHLDGNFLLPDLVILSMAICFSIAIVSRIQLLQQALVAKDSEAHRLALDIRQGQLKQRELALEKEQIQTALSKAELEQQLKQTEADELNQVIAHLQAATKNLNGKLETNQRELASATLYMVQKNALLAHLKQQIQAMNNQNPNNKQKELSGIKDILQSNLRLDHDWNRFRLHFEQVHPHFFKELEAKYPSLTKNDLRLLSYFHINLSTKEIAGLLNIDPASVRTAKTRLYKKMASVDKGLASNGPDDKQTRA